MPGQTPTRRPTARRSRSTPTGDGTRRSQRQRFGLGALGAVLGIGAVVALSGWLVLRNDQAEPTGAAGAAVGVVHIHGLGINPTDGVLYTATHNGLFRITAEGAAERVGKSMQDVMGFTVLGPDRFVASGHPDLQQMRQQNLPPLLGLLESTDGGRTWQTRSLLGQADFHALHTAHGQIYGWNTNGGAFMVSTDGTNWEHRSTLVLTDFAVSPTDPASIVATARDGLQRSTNGGRTWERLSAPQLASLAWEKPDALVGIAATGAVYVSPDAGVTWQQRGLLPGQPVALIASEGALYAAAHNGGIFASQDGGATWQLRYRDRSAS